LILTTTKKLERNLERASSYEEWRQAAQAYDAHTGLDRWKIMDQSRRYDYVSIRVRLDRLRALRARHDDRGLLFNLNEGIHGNMGGMGRSSLYEKAKFGTKQLIVEYVDEIVSALEHLASPEVDGITVDEKLDFFHRADHCFGRSAFMMSGSGSLFYFHIGVVRALLQEQLLPSILSGSSGGSFVGSLLCTRGDAELIELLEPDNLIRKVEETVGDMKKPSRYKPSVMPIEAIRRTIENLIPDLTFQEALERTGRHLNISIAAVETHQKSRLLNAIASPNVFIREAVLASGAVPGVYPPVTLAAKNHLGEKQAYLPSRRWVDGSVSDDMPAKRLARLYGVNHYIVSQTNPYVIPFIDTTKRKTDAVSEVKYAMIDTARAWINASAAIFEKPLSLIPDVQRITNSALSVINQSYVGDITISPLSKIHNPLRALSWRTREEISELIEEGERATWPRIERIRIQTRISRTLDPILRACEEHHVEQYGKPAKTRGSRPRRRKAS
jgi:TAG lipase/steryl ester hydrolase/phospholipase A2/LPA acyltransferase